MSLTTWRRKVDNKKKREMALAHFLAASCRGTCAGDLRGDDTALEVADMKPSRPCVEFDVAFVSMAESRRRWMAARRTEGVPACRGGRPRRHRAGAQLGGVGNG
jgi:hypothetical protein